MLNKYQFYGPYADFVIDGHITINTSEISKNNWQSHCDGILNILKDGIETDFIKKSKITVQFSDGPVVNLTVPDYFINIIMWRMIVFTDHVIISKHLFFAERITQKVIANYINENLIKPCRKFVDSKILNNTIDDTLHTIKYIDDFSLFFANTINISDDVLMMKKIPRYREIMNADLSNVPIENVKDEGMKLTNELISYILDSKKYLGFDHSLTNAFRSGESIRPRQYKEANVNIGTKPDGMGSVFSHITNNSFINGGVTSSIDYFIDASNGRTAQILSKNNVGSSGSYARILGLNSINTIFHEDPNYACDTKNLQKYYVADSKHFKLIIDRYFRWQDGDVTTTEDDILITEDMENELVGKTIFLRSPITCASASRGDGVCYRCYGDIAYTNADINPGEFAAELVSSQLTQRLLSAKHLLETKIDEIVWTDGFFDIFEVQDNEIKLIPDINVKGATLEIDPNDIILENEDDDYSDNPDIILYNEYVQKFTIHGNNKDVKINKEISSAAGDALYISNTLNSIIKSKAIPVDDKIVIPLSALVDKTIFYIKIKNNELSKAMETLKDILDKNGVTLRMDRNQIMQAYIDAAIDGGITMAAVHGEILIMNQIRAADNILETVDWSEPHAPYQVTTLRRALMYNPSATITLSYQDLSKVLYSPLTFKKRGVSFLDLFFMKTPQQFIKSSDALVSNKEFKSDVETNGKPLFTFLSPDRAPKVDDTNI